MQPRKLIMENFGPFIHEEVDFGLFEGSGLVLISGKTGAGKTTIFDGMTYALFGQTSGKLRSPKEMRSAFANDSELTAVAFTFEHGGYLYEVERQPEQSVAKKRGTGMTKKAAKTTLTIYEENGQELRQYTKDVDRYLQDLLQLTPEEFFKIILLPQGEFRNFLIASSLEKEQVLRRLFDTRLYNDLNAYFKEKVTAGSEGLLLIEMKAETLKDHFQWYQEAATGSTWRETLALWQKDLQALNEHYEKQATEFLQVKKTETKAEKAYYQGTALAKRFADLAHLKEEALLIEGQEKQMALKEEELNKILWSQAEAATLTARNQAETYLQQVTKQANLLSEKLTEITKQQQKWQQALPAIEKKQQQLKKIQAESITLAAQIPLAEKAQRKQRQLAEKKQLVAELTEKLATLTQKTTEKKAELADLQIILQLDYGQDEFRLENLKKEVAAIQQASQQLTELKEKKQTTSQEKATVTQQLQEDQVNYQELTQQLKQLKSDQAGMLIAKLALDLQPGQPCPICGSLEHPGHGRQLAKYSPKEIAKVESKLTKVEEKQQQLQKRLSNQEAKMLQLTETYESLTVQISQAEGAYQNLLTSYQKNLPTNIKECSLTPKESLEVFIRQVTEEKEKQAAAKIQAAKVTNELAVFSESSQKLQAEKAQADSIWQQLTGEVHSMTEQLAGNDLKSLNTLLADLATKQGDLQKEVSQHETAKSQIQTDLLTTTTRWKESKNQVASQQKKVAEAAEKVQTVLKTGPVADEAQWVALLENSGDSETLTAEIAEYQRQKDYVWQTKNNLENELAKALPPDVEALAEAFKGSKAASESAQIQLNTLNSQLAANQKTLATLEGLITENETAMAQQSQLIQLADTLNGRNSYKTSLERYILQSYLEEILEVANHRLQSLTKGRYQFLLAKASGGRGMKGLDIDIYDDNAGETRRVQTLSGGESFIAALALALSLGDVIQSRSGGIAIEALFIDEGFGSLDEESLEMAMEALNLIETEGRLIGIISHVAELKTSIPRQILVKTNGSGQSKIQLQLGFAS